MPNICRPGVDILINNLSDFRQFSPMFANFRRFSPICANFRPFWAEKIGVFLKNQRYDHFFQKSPIFRKSILLGKTPLPRIRTWLPDGIFSNKKSKFGYIFEGLRIENVAIFYAHLEYMHYSNLAYFMVIWYFCGNFPYFPRFGIFCQETSGNRVYICTYTLIAH
jgi:hypothetical protein